MKSLLCSALLGVVAVTSVQAAPVELAVSTEGSGRVTVGSSGDRVSKANVVLKRDGKFSIGLVGGNDNRFTGTWRPSGRDDIYLSIREANGNEADGSGTVSLRSRRGDYEVDSISISGETERGRSISARFDAPNYRPVPLPPPAPRVVLDTEQNGSGRLEVGGRSRYRVNRVHVQLYNDGRAHVHTEGDAALRYEGSWTSGGESTSTLNVRGGLDGERLSGIVRHRGGRLWRLELSGTRGSKYYSLEFGPGR